jgi:hypothetical protein
MKKFQMSFVHMYPLNLLEREGLGLTYEHFVKWRLLQRFFSKTFIPKSILVAGLSQKYGFNVDFLMLAHFLQAKIYFLDERGQKLKKLNQAIRKVKKKGYTFKQNQIQLIKVEDLIKHKFDKTIDLLINCEVLQQYNKAKRINFMENFLPICQIAAFFAPNKKNKAHLLISKLPALTVNQLKDSVKRDNFEIFSTGFIDAPPFPPGIKRTNEQRGKLQNSLFGKTMMLFLTLWAFLEKILPKPFLKKKAHLVYLLLRK